MRRPGSPSVLVQVALLAAFAVIASQVVAFVVVLTAPPPRPAGFSIASAAEALKGRPAQTSDGRPLRRTLAARPGVEPEPRDPVAAIIGSTVAGRLGLEREDVRVRLQRSPPTDGPPGVREVRHLMMRRQDPEAESPALGAAAQAAIAIENARRQARNDDLATGLAAELAARRVHEALPAGEFHIVIGSNEQRIIGLADSLTFRPFAVSARLADGRWATVEPPRGWIDPWQARLLMALAITALLLAPLVWLMARRLTRPIRAFALAAERLGADPDAEPLTPSGPSEVRTAIGAFNDMQASLRRHMRQRTQTIAAIAHDLRTPLTRLRFRAEQAPEALRDRMAADVEEMDALIAQAMAFVRGDQPAERRERVDLAVLAADCATGFAETGADVRFEGDASLPVLGDPAALRRALANLIDNAVTFAGSARVLWSRQNDRAVVTVADDGPGLPDHELEAAFEPFHRGERSRSRQTGGAGLGLAVARQAARAAGGDVVLANRASGGLEARLTLPLAS